MTRRVERLSEKQLNMIALALNKQAELLELEGIEPAGALYISAVQLDGAAEATTVLSPATCTQLGGIKLNGLTGPDSIKERTDLYASTANIRRKRAEAGKDKAAEWLEEREKELGKLG